MHKITPIQRISLYKYYRRNNPFPGFPFLQLFPSNLVY